MICYVLLRNMIMLLCAIVYILWGSPYLDTSLTISKVVPGRAPKEASKSANQGEEQERMSGRMFELWHCQS